MTFVTVQIVVVSDERKEVRSSYIFDYVSLKCSSVSWNTLELKRNKSNQSTQCVCERIKTRKGRLPVYDRGGGPL